MNNIYRYIIVIITSGVLILTLIVFLFLPLITKKGNNIYLPDVRSLNILKAEQILIDLEFKILTIKASYNDKYKPNDVISMNPRPFTKLKKGRIIKLKVASDKDDIVLNNYIGISLRNAKITLERMSLYIDTLIYEFDNKIKKNYIIDQYPRHGKILKTNEQVTFIVSLGSPPDYYVVPDLINVNLRKGKEIILNTGLIIGNIKYEYNKQFLNHTILEQDLTAGMKLSFPNKINLIVSTDRIQINE